MAKLPRAVIAANDLVVPEDCTLQNDTLCP
jgi:hypothetical protein